MIYKQKQTDEIKDIIENVNKTFSHRKTIQEDTFLDGFLGMLWTWFNKEKTTPNGDPLNLEVWSSVSGNLYKEVDVLDHSNNVLFTVPPLLVKIDLKMDGGTFFDISGLFKKKGNFLVENKKKQAIRQLNNGMKITKINANELLNRWVEIFSRYGLIDKNHQLEVNEELYINDDIPDDAFGGF